MKDDAFIRGEQPMTKMEVRSTIVSYMSLEPGQHILEIGAGTGSVTVQMAKSCPGMHLTAIERTPSGCALIQQNINKHGVDVRIIEGEVPDVECPEGTLWDGVFIGGTGKRFKDIMIWLESGRMKVGATLVFSTITLESMHDIFAYLTEASSCYHAIEASQLSVSRLENLGRYHYFKPLNPCTVIKCTYGGQHV
jgi:cobalt-precorrin-6B (C15)-methyltransferase